ncbi:MAG: RNA repair domain-containing protein [Promethearchaeota archaeon]
MTKKGEIKEWLSRIQYGSEIRKEFSIIFRDFDEYVELSFDEFMARRQIDSIPLHRITQIRQQGVPIFTRPNFCPQCGNPVQEEKCQNKLCSESV